MPLVLLLLVLLLPGVARAAPDTRAEWRPGPCPFALEAARAVECGVLMVPENRAREGSRLIPLAVRILRAPRPSGLPPVVYLSGGPGQSMEFDTVEGMEGWIDDIEGRNGAWAWMRGRDVILYSQRGLVVGGKGMECPELGDPRVYLGAAETPQGQTDWRENLRAANAACLRRLRAQGYDLDGYSTRESAADLAALRRALGIERWVLFGISYGTRLGLVTLRDHPEGIVAAILDSVFPPQVTDHWWDPTPIADALYMLFRSCRADRACNRAYPRLEARFDRMLARLREEPMPVRVTDPSGESRPLHFTMDESTLIDMVFFDLYWTSDIAALPRALDALDRGDADTFAELVAAPYVFETLFTGWSYGMQSAVNCNDDGAFHDRAKLEEAIAAHPRLAAWLATSLEIEPCEGWPRLPRDSGASRPARSDVPVLLLAGVHDPVTPVSYADLALRHLRNGQLLVVPGAAHSVTDEAECARRAIAAFLADPASRVTRECDGRDPGIAFELP